MSECVYLGVLYEHITVYVEPNICEERPYMQENTSELKNASTFSRIHPWKFHQVQKSVNQNLNILIDKRTFGIISFRSQSPFIQILSNFTNTMGSAL